MTKITTKAMAASNVTFVHSLFRSGSTYFYNALKRSEKVYVYHEPMHEVIASLPNSWGELSGRKDQLKSTLRHDFLIGGYFDEFSHLLPSIKKTFDPRFSFDYYFMEAGGSAPDQKAYIDLLVDGAPKPPVLQCTRTSGRIGWLRENYKSNHIFLLRNPWDQWYSYKVDPYIATTPRIIYSQSNLPEVLGAVFEASGANPLVGCDTQEKLACGFKLPLTPDQDYFLFYGLWLYSLVCGERDCDVVIDMDELSASTEYQANCLASLEKIGIQSIDFSDARLQRAVFDEREQAGFRIVEEQVLEIYRQHSMPIGVAREYLDAARRKSFVSPNKLEAAASGMLEDARRMRELLAARDVQIVSLSQAVSERDGQIAGLSQALSERDSQITGLSQAVSERDGQIAGLSQALSERDSQITGLSQAVSERDGQIISLTDEAVRRGVWALGLDAELREERAKVAALTMSLSWRITAPLREARRWIASPSVQAKRHIKAALLFAQRTYQSLPLSSQTKAKHHRWIAKVAPRILLATGAHPSTIPVLNIPQPSTGKVTIQAKSPAIESQHIRAASISITKSDNPLVTVIIPIYGKVDYTLRCLASVAAHPSLVELEVIVVDDCSPDDSWAVLSQKVKGIRIIRNEHNQGFIRSCNTGANAAKGQYLYFLNNDTEVTEGWLDALLRTFSDFPGAGLAGSKLVYPDGRLQEAGGIIWQDGSAWNFGRFQDPQLPVYNYAREVDYCSGASIMVPKSLFEEIGGFDEHYLPAYCEDSDLALKIRDKGYRIIYQPLSTVIHYEGISSGTDTTQGVKAYQVENSKKLFERWQQRLQFHQSPGNDVEKVKDRTATRRVLVLDHCTPTPNMDAGSVTAFNLLLLLREMDFQVTFIPEDNFLFMADYTPALQRSGIEVLYAPYVTSVEQHLKESGGRYDLALLFRPGVVERHVKTVRKYCPNAKVLFHTVDLHYLRMSREAQLLEDKSKLKAAEDMQQREIVAIRSVDASVVHSTAELEILKPLLPEAKLHVFPLIMDVKGADKTFSDRRDIVFVGGYRHTPNVDAVRYFVKDVMPMLREQLPGVRFYVVGSEPPAEIQALVSEDVIITGFVEDLNPLLDKMRVSVAPLRYGAGIKGKIGTAMAVGLPVVATSLATEGMSLTDGENILVADGPEAFANAVARIYRDEALWHNVSQNGLAFAVRAWGAEAAWGTLAGILCELDFTPARNKRGLSLYTSNSQGAFQSKKKDFEKPTIKQNDDYQKKIRQELAIYEKQINVHDLPDIYHYWSNKYLASIFRDAGFSTIAEFFSSNLLVAARRTHASSASFVSVGAGNCDLEVAIAKNLINAGLDNFTLECLEINPVMLERGKESAKEKGVLKNMLFVEADFNTWIPDKQYDGVMANQSLHHVVQLEHLFYQVKNALHENGSFVISDMIGRNGHQRWPEALEIVNRFWKELPDSKKFNVLLNRIEKEYDNWDCSKEGFEGIRSQDILPLLVQIFQCERFIGFGNVIDVFVDRCFGHNFNRDSQEDRGLIDRVHAEDEAGFASGFLKPTHMMAVFVQTLHCAPYCSRGITPASAIRNPTQ
jgi:GT2 family glycosyltransferase/glycosyltransferase involved in cell wall biosynthesis/SAM-dependent methyltransferase